MALRLLRGGSPRCIGLLSLLVVILLCLYYISIGQSVSQPKEFSTKKLFSDDAAALVKYNNIESDLTKSNNEERSFGINSRSINSNNIGQKCSALKEAAADITTIEEYQKFDFQPNWMKNKEYWDATFEERYEKHMKNEKRPPLKVIIVPFSHNDPGWLKTFLNYFQSDSRQILNFVISKMQEYTDMTFIWAEISFLQLWWDQAHPTKQRALKHLINSGRFEITTGGWVMTDEANVHIYAMLDQLIEGHQWLKANLNYTPTTGWSIDPFGHGSTLPYLLASSGFEGIAIQRIHYAWKQYLAKYQYGDFMWTPYWTGNGAKTTDRTILTHNMPFDIYSIKHSCGPHPFICLNFDFRKVPGEYTEYSIKAQFITDENVAAKADLLLEQYSKTASLYPHNVALIPLGDDFRYNREKEVEQQYVNYKKLIDYITNNPTRYNNTKISFGLPRDYFREIQKRHDKYPSLKGDFFVYSDIFTEGRPAYWSGYFTTRPLYKMLSRELEQNIRSLEILFTLAFNLARQKNHNNALRIYEKNYEKLTEARRNLGLFQHHDAITGTSKAVVMRDYGIRLFESLQNVVHLQERTIELLIQTAPTADEHGFILNELERESFNKVPKKTPIFLQPNKSVEFVVFNSLAQERLEVVLLRTQTPNVKILDQNGHEVNIQINPVWNISESAEALQSNTLRVADRQFEVIFVAKMPPLSLLTYTVVYTEESTKKTRATIYCDDCRAKNADPKTQTFTVRKKQSGDIQLENLIMRLLFDGTTGFLRSITPKKRGKSMQCALNFAAYRSAQFHSGAYLFKPDRDEQDTEKDVLVQYTGSQMIFITSGPLASDVTVIYGNFLAHTMRIYNTGTALDNAIYIENDIDFELPPKNRETELFMRFVTDIDNGITPTLFTDQNGFQHHRRVKVASLGVEANYYPITTSAFIQDNELRLTLLTNHAQGVTSYEPGHLEAMLDRRTLYDDYRGMGEGVVDSRLTRQKYWLVLEQFNEPTTEQIGTDYEMPSNFVNQLSNIHNNPANIYFIDRPDELQKLELKKKVSLLAKKFPCDVHLLTLRTQTEPNLPLFPSKSAFMVLHRPGVSCKIKEIPNVCSGHYGGSFAGVDGHGLNLFDRTEVQTMRATSLTGLLENEAILELSVVSVKPMDIVTFNLTFV